MPSVIKEKSKIFGIYVFLLFMSISPLMADDVCPQGTDPVYCKIAGDTGGEVYSGKIDAEISKEVLEKDKKRTNEIRTEKVTTHKYSPYSKDIGCSDFVDTRSREICDSISVNLEWGWTGHATIAPGWKVNWNSIKNVYCDKKIDESDLQTLEKMCGSKIHPYMSCITPMDARLASGIEFLIKTVQGLKTTPEDLKDTVFDSGNKDYLLKEGC